MRSLPLVALSLGAVLALAACGGGGGGGAPSASATAAAPSASGSAAPSSSPSGGTGSVTAEDLEGRTFIVTGAEGYTIVPGSEISLTFRGGQVAVSAGCNQMSGSFAIEDGRLVVGSMMSTEMACDHPLMAQDTWISGFLPDATVALDADTLTLTKDDATLTATDKEVARPDRPLEGTRWVVDGLVADQAVSSLPMGVTAALTFADGKVDVEAGCNGGSGEAAVEGTVITFGPVVTTKMACEAPAMGVEQHVLGVLAGDVGFEIDGDTLQLSGPGGGLTLRAEG